MLTAGSQRMANEEGALHLKRGQSCVRGTLPNRQAGQVRLAAAQASAGVGAPRHKTEMISTRQGARLDGQLYVPHRDVQVAKVRPTFE